MNIAKFKEQMNLLDKLIDEARLNDKPAQEVATLFDIKANLESLREIYIIARDQIK